MGSLTLLVLSCGVQDVGAEDVKAWSAVHGSFDGPDSVHLSFDRAHGPRHVQRRLQDAGVAPQPRSGSRVVTVMSSASIRFSSPLCRNRWCGLPMTASAKPGRSASRRVRKRRSPSARASASAIRNRPRREPDGGCQQAFAGTSSDAPMSRSALRRCLAQARTQVTWPQLPAATSSRQSSAAVRRPSTQRRSRRAAVCFKRTAPARLAPKRAVSANVGLGLPRSRGSPALCVDRSGLALIVGGGCWSAHRAGHEQALSHAGLPHRRDHIRWP